ncbi:MAG: DnaB-like helicase C-terminal domain-containing protein [Acetobacter orientalis]|uniref:replicative DNA helicase n=1 Tax=Acetobacter TaxID=434 RepID=UPI0039EB5CFB
MANLEPMAPIVPSNAYAERALVGSVMANAKAFDEIGSRISADMFAEEGLRAIWGVISQAHRKSGSCGMEVIAPSIAALGPDYTQMMAGLIAQYPVCEWAMLGTYCAAVRESHARREIQRIAKEAEWNSGRADGTAEDALQQLVASAERIADGMDADRPAVSAGDAAMKLVQETEANWNAGNYMSGLRCGLEGLDIKLRGFRPGGMYVVAARPGAGKSALGLTLATRMAKQEGRGLVWSGEMKAEELMARAIAAKLHIPFDEVITGMWRDHTGCYHRISSEKMDRVVRASLDLRDVPMEIDDREGITVAQLAARARRMKRQAAGLKFIVADYIGLMSASASVQRSGRRVEIVTEISGDLAKLARELDVPIIVLTQLNRENEKRDDRRPTLSDIRESGAIEQDARCVIGIYREEMSIRLKMGADGRPVRNANETDAAYMKRANELTALLEEVRGQAELIVLKNRGGTTGIVPALYDGPGTWFRDASEGERSTAW